MEYKEVERRNVLHLQLSNASIDHRPGEQEREAKLMSTKAPNYESFDELMKLRKEKLNRMCDGHFISPNAVTSSLTNLRLLTNRKFLWCPVHKVATTDMYEKIVLLSDKGISTSDFDMPYHAAEKVLNKISTKFLRTTKDLKSLLIVRHPFERIVSAFRDKLERTHPDTDFYYQRYGARIVQLFRAKAKKALGDDFLSKENNYGAPLPVIPKSRRKDYLPTFWEFVQFLLHTGVYTDDTHWHPITQSCPVCSIDFDFILKMENLKLEQDSFVRKMGWYSILNGTEQRKNHNEYHNMTMSQITQLYLKDVADTDIVMLYNRYKADFLLFDYNFKRGSLTLP